jgi:hypothetical protein
MTEREKKEKAPEIMHQGSILTACFLTFSFFGAGGDVLPGQRAAD